MKHKNLKTITKMYEIFIAKEIDELVKSKSCC